MTRAHRGYRLRHRVICWAFTVAFALAACSPADEPQDQATENAALAQERRAFRTHFEQDLEKINRMAATMEAHADDVSENVREELSKRLRKLREETAALRQELIELESVGDSTFLQLRPVLERRYATLSDDVELARLSTKETWADFREAGERYLGTLERQITNLKREGELLEDEIVVGDSIRYGALWERHDELRARLQKEPHAADMSGVRAEILRQIAALLEEIRSATRRTEMAA